jgi:transcriptional regulator with XRE-family HTH domain
MNTEYNHSYIDVNNFSYLTTNNHSCKFLAMDFCDRLKLAREYAKLTQQELVDRLGQKPDGKPLMSQANLAKMESSKSAKGSIYTIFIAKACGVSPEWLANEIGPMLAEGVMVYKNTPEAKVLMAMEHMDEMTKYQVVKISDSLADLKPLIPDQLIKQPKRSMKM